DLHERAGSSNVIHLHGELLKVRSIKNEEVVKPWSTNLNIGDLDENGHQLRPNIVWFGEAVPMIDKAVTICNTADILLIIGTSMQVYPAASLMHYVPENTPTYFIDPNPAISNSKNITVIKNKTTEGIQEFINLIN
ncbi:MAG: Sir2 family NAD-dependent protein deacetylase, partial [Lacinutrix sp.]|uniref:Sir2 family NAD-dependent protein deacetylase n=1 Tax=Lacinutrix sp. TaxID=1937692 RepID=UPI0030A67E32